MTDINDLIEAARKANRMGAFPPPYASMRRKLERDLSCSVEHAGHTVELRVDCSCRYVRKIITIDGEYSDLRAVTKLAKQAAE